MLAIGSKKSINSFLKKFGSLLFISTLLLIIAHLTVNFFGMGTFPAILIFASIITFIFIFIERKNKIESKRIIAALKSIKESIPKQETEKETKQEKELEIVLQKLIQEISGDLKYLNKLEKMRSEFLGNVSHELKTPIFAIQGFLETLINGAIDDENVNQVYLRKAASHTEKLNQLVSDLIDISMIETGQMRMSFRYFDLARYLKEIYNEYLPLAQSKNLQFEVSEINPKLSVFGDKNRLNQVFSNLISNAIKYTDHGKIIIAVEEFGETAKISLSDTGIGISAEDLPRVFERFYRVDKARSREIGGTGLGLSIVKHILERHQSQFEIESNPGIGTRFTFTLRK